MVCSQDDVFGLHKVDKILRSGIVQKESARGIQGRCCDRRNPWGFIGQGDAGKELLVGKKTGNPESARIPEHIDHIGIELDCREQG